MMARAGPSNRDAPRTGYGGDSDSRREENSEQQAQTYAEQVGFLYVHALPAYSITFVAGLVLVFFLWPEVHHGALLLWLAVLSVILIGRGWLAYQYHCTAPPVADAAPWGRWFVVGVVASAATWGAGGVLLYPSHSVVHQSFLVFLLGGMAAGAAAVLAARKEAYLGYVLPIMAPITLRLLFEGDRVHTIMGFMAVLLVAIVLESARRSHQVIRDAFALRYQKDMLVNQLGSAIEHNELLLNAAAEGIFGVNKKGDISFANAAVSKLLGWDKGRLLGLPVRQLLYYNNSYEAARASNPILSTLKDGATRVVQDGRFRKRDGSALPVEFACNSIEEGGVVTGAVVTFSDITERKRSQQQLRQMNARLHSIIRAVPNPYFQLAVDGTVLGFTPGRESISDLRPEEFLGRRIQEKLPAEAGKALEQALATVLTSTDPAQIEYTLHPKGIEKNYEARFVSLGDDQVLMWVRDVTGRKQAERRLTHLAQYDFLTGLANRALLMDTLAQAKVRADGEQYMMGLLFLDLDNFKTINDRLGHDAGDQLLQEVARRLKGAVRGEDTVARMGGDEFVVLLERIGAADGAATVAKKVSEALGHGVQLGDEQIEVTTSIGIALYPVDTDDLEQLLKLADAAMYEAKRGGRNGYRFYKSEQTALG